MKTELQKQFEEQTPTIKGITGTEYLQTFISWLHLQVEKAHPPHEEEIVKKFTDQVIDQDIDLEFVNIVNENFWDLLKDTPPPHVSEERIEELYDTYWNEQDPRNDKLLMNKDGFKAAITELLKR